MTHAFFGEPRMPRLSKLLQEVKQGEILIPKFQRPFVWDDDQRLALMGSIYSGYPIGAMIVWRTQKHDLATYENLGPFRLPQAKDPSLVRQYLLDGHQRMTTLFAALGPGLYEDEELPNVADDHDDSAPWRIYFDLESQDKEPFCLVPAYAPSRPTLLRLDILLDPYKLNDFGLNLQKAGYDRKMVNRVHSIAEKFRDYQIPVMPIATEDLEQVTVSFKRINSSGSSMSEVHMVNALGHGRKFDLLEKLAEVSETLKPVGWEHFGNQMILHACKLRLGMELYRDDAEVLAAKLAGQQDVFQQAASDIVRAARVLDSIAGVRTPRSLPYRYQALLIADALHELDGDEPSDEIKSQLRKWFWATTLSEYFSGITNSRLERARLHLHEVVAGKGNAVPPDLRERIVLPVRQFNYSHARCRGIALLLAEQGPVTLDPANQRTMDGFALLGTYGADALVKLVRENELDESVRHRARGPENRFLVEPTRANSVQDLRLHPTPFESRTLASHRVDKETMEALADGDIAEFLRLRRQGIEHLEAGHAKECGIEYRLTYDGWRDRFGST